MKTQLLISTACLSAGCSSLLGTGAGSGLAGTAPDAHGQTIDAVVIFTGNQNTDHGRPMEAQWTVTDGAAPAPDGHPAARHDAWAPDVVPTYDMTGSARKIYDVDYARRRGGGADAEAMWRSGLTRSRWSLSR